MKTYKKAALVGGISYVLLILAGLFAELFVRGGLIVAGDAGATMQNILDKELLFRMGFLSDLSMVVLDIIVGIAFYVLLRDKGKIIALSGLILRLVQSTLIAMNLLNMHEVLILMDMGENMGTQVMVSLMNFQYGYYLALVFFGLYLVVLSCQLGKNRIFVPVITKFMGLAGILYVADSLVNFIYPDFAPITGSMPVMLIWIITEFSIAGALIALGLGKKEIYE